MRIPGVLDTNLIRLGMEYQKVTALLCAVIDAQGQVTLTKEQAEKEWGGARLYSRNNPDGSLTLSLAPLGSDSSQLSGAGAGGQQKLWKEEEGQ